MASDIHAVLLIPAEGDPRGLLHEGPCGARPPMAQRFTCGEHGDGLWAVSRWVSPHCYQAVPAGNDETGRCFKTAQGTYALVLAWDGEVVTEGMDRAGLACCPAPRWPNSTPLAEVAEWYAGQVERFGIGTIVLLDAEGREVTDSE